MDLEALAKEFADLSRGIDGGNKTFAERHAKIESDLQALVRTTDDLNKGLELIEGQIKMPSLDGLEALVNLAELEGVDLRVVLEMIEEELRRGELPSSLKSLLLPPGDPGTSTKM